MIDEEALAREGLPIVEGLVRRYERQLGGLISRDELYAIGRPALFDAVRSFDPARSPFPPYATNKIKWAILDNVRRDLRRRRLAGRAMGCAAWALLADAPSEPPSAMRPDTEHQRELGAYLARRAAALVMGAATIPEIEGHVPQRVPNPEDVLLDVELRASVRSAVNELEDPQRALVERYYFGDEKFEDIAADLGLSKSWASRLHRKALESLADRLKTKLIRKPSASAGAPKPRASSR